MSCPRTKAHKWIAVAVFLFIAVLSLIHNYSLPQGAL